MHEGAVPQLQIQPKVLVVEQHAPLRSELCAQLGKSGLIVLADDADDDLETIVTVFRPDLVLLELDGHDPSQLVAQIKHVADILVMVMVPETAEASTRVAALRAGACDLIALPPNIDEVVLRVHGALARNLPAPTLRIHDVEIDHAGHTVQRNGHALDLTETEFRLLVTLATNAGVVLSKRHLLSAVWGFDDYDVNLVEVHVSALRRKLEAHGPRMIETVRALGYVIRQSRQATLPFNSPTDPTPRDRKTPSRSG